MIKNEKKIPSRSFSRRRTPTLAMCTLPPPKTMFQTACLQEDHGKSIYCVAFSKIMPTFFATVGANRLSIYECRASGAIELVQVYADEDADEVYFTCAWSFIAGEDESPVPVVVTAGSRGVIKVIDVTAQQVCYYFLNTL